MRIHSGGQAAGISGAQSVSCARPRLNCKGSGVANESGAQLALSTRTELVQKLTALKSSDPAAFKQVTNRVAEHFDQLAHYASGSARTTLSELARSFASAAESGDLSGLAPPSPAQAPASPPAPPSAPEPPDPVETARATALALAASFVTGANGAPAGDPLAALGALRATDPSAFRTTMNGVAERLEQLAHYAEGAERDALHDFAVRFSSAAETGDLSGFQPPVSAEPPAQGPEPPTTTSAPAPEPRRCGHAFASYRRHCAPPPCQQVDDAYSAALSLVNSLVPSDPS